MSVVAEMPDSFPRDTAKHEMAVLRNDGLYRHLRFRNPENSFYWFDLVTWPGVLAIHGDMDSFMFSRIEDMFEFFRGRTINPQYWEEKIRGGTRTKRYSEDAFRQHVTEYVAEAIRYGSAPRGIGKAVRLGILDDPDTCDENYARLLLRDFEFKGFEFHDTWEWDLTAWTHQYLWCCHAIQYGIARYDIAKKEYR